MSGTTLLPAYGGMAATPASAETLAFLKAFPYKFINQDPDATGAEAASASSSPTSSGQGLAPGYDGGGAVDPTQTQPAGLAGAATVQPVPSGTAGGLAGAMQGNGGQTLSLQQLIAMGLLQPGAGQINTSGDPGGASAVGAGGAGGAAPAGAQAAAAGAGASAGGITSTPGMSLAQATGDIFGGAAAPSTSALAQATGAPQGLVSGLFGAATNLAGPAGMALGLANTAGNIANTISNGSMLAAVGAPLSAGQYVGGFMGLNGYAGTPSTAQTSQLNHLGNASEPDLPAITGLVGAMTSPMGISPNDVGGTSSGSAAGNAASSAMGAAAGDVGSAAASAAAGANAGGGSAEDSDSGFAIGGVIKNSSTRGFLRDLAKGSGLVKGLTGGRADAVHTSVPRGSYVMPADVVSGMGGGNTMAGAKYMTGVLKPLPKLPGFRNGGNVQPVRVRLSAGEYVVHPAHAAALGRGNLQLGHMILDDVVRQVRQRVAKQALTAPPPK